MGRPKKLSTKRLNQCKEAGFKTAMETGLELEDYDRMKLELSKKGFFILKCGHIRIADCITDWNVVKNNLSKDDSLKWIFYYFESNGRRISEKKGGRKMKIFEKITNQHGEIAKECPIEFKGFLMVNLVNNYFLNLK
jgi:hypothetical protein